MHRTHWPEPKGRNIRQIHVQTLCEFMTLRLMGWFWKCCCLVMSLIVFLPLPPHSPSTFLLPDGVWGPISSQRERAMECSRRKGYPSLPSSPYTIPHTVSLLELCQVPSLPPHIRLRVWSGILAQPHSPIGRVDYWDKGDWRRGGAFMSWFEGDVSGHVWDESDTRQDVLATQRARLQL